MFCLACIHWKECLEKCLEKWTNQNVLIISIRPIIASKNLDFIRSNIVVLTEIIVDLKPENYDSFSIRISINRIGIFLNVCMYIYVRTKNKLFYHWERFLAGRIRRFWSHQAEFWLSRKKELWWIPPENSIVVTRLSFSSK